MSPLFCVQSAAARLTSSRQVLNAAERISVRDAIATMTVHAAFEEHLKGALEVRELGDLVVLQQDPLPDRAARDWPD